MNQAFSLLVTPSAAQLKMLPEFYLTSLHSQLSASQLLTLEMLVWLLQFHKQVRIERLAACLPLPILYESRRRHVQRFLILPQLSIPLLRNLREFIVNRLVNKPTSFRRLRE